MDCGADCVCAGPLGFCFENEASVERSVVYALKGCVSYFEAELVGGISESMHAASFCFGYSPPQSA